MTLYDSDGKEIPVTLPENTDERIEIRIPRDPSFVIPPMSTENVTSFNQTPHHAIFNLHFVNITSDLPISVHIEMKPDNISLAYLFIYRFDQSPQLNSSIEVIDGWTLLCPESE